MPAEVSKNEAPVAVFKEAAVMEASNKGELSRLRSMLHTMRTNKEREMESDQAEIDTIKHRMEKRERELFVIRGREQAITAAVRHLEDLGIVT